MNNQSNRIENSAEKTSPFSEMSRQANELLDLSIREGFDIDQAQEIAAHWATRTTPKHISREQTKQLEYLAHKHPEFHKQNDDASHHLLFEYALLTSLQEREPALERLQGIRVSDINEREDRMHELLKRPEFKQQDLNAPYRTVSKLYRDFSQVMKSYGTETARLWLKTRKVNLVDGEVKTKTFKSGSLAQPDNYFKTLFKYFKHIAEQDQVKPELPQAEQAPVEKPIIDQPSQEEQQAKALKTAQVAIEKSESTPKAFKRRYESKLYNELMASAPKLPRSVKTMEDASDYLTPYVESQWTQWMETQKDRLISINTDGREHQTEDQIKEATIAWLSVGIWQQMRDRNNEKKKDLPKKSFFSGLLSKFKSLFS